MTAENKRRGGVESKAPEPLPFDADATARQVADFAKTQIAQQYSKPDRWQLEKMVRMMRRNLIPRRPAGRKLLPSVTAAYWDYMQGMRGLPLYLKHIAGFAEFNRYHKRAEAERLMSAIRSRIRRCKGSTAVPPFEQAS